MWGQPVHHLKECEFPEIGIRGVETPHAVLVEDGRQMDVWHQIAPGIDPMRGIGVGNNIGGWRHQWLGSPGFRILARIATPFPRR